MSQQLALLILAEDGATALRRLAEQASAVGCNISEARGTPLGNRTAIVLLTEGTWDAVARLEQGLERLAAQLHIELLSARVEPAPAPSDHIPYAVDLSCADKPGVLSALIDFFIHRKIMIMELTARSYPAAHTGAPLFAVQLNIGIPRDLHLAPLREEFMDFCDGLNLDAILEPIKG